MTTEELGDLIFDLYKALAFVAERRERRGLGPEVFALHISSLYDDDVHFRANHEKIVIAFARGGREELNALELNDREIVNLTARFIFATVVLSQILKRRLDETAVQEKIVECAKQDSIPLDAPEVQKLLRESAEFFSPLFADFDPSSLEGDREAALRALLIDRWNKCEEADFAKLRSDCLEMIAHVAGFRAYRPQLGPGQTERD